MSLDQMPAPTGEPVAQSIDYIVELPSGIWRVVTPDVPIAAHDFLTTRGWVRSGRGGRHRIQK